LIGNRKRLLGATTLFVGLALTAAACGDSGSTKAASTTTVKSSATSVASTTTIAATTTTKPPDVTGTLNASGATFPQAF
jgi:hypothetical protein